MWVKLNDQSKKNSERKKDMKNIIEKLILTLKILKCLLIYIINSIERSLNPAVSLIIIPPNETQVFQLISLFILIRDKKLQDPLFKLDFINLYSYALFNILLIILLIIFLN